MRAPTSTLLRQERGTRGLERIRPRAAPADVSQPPGGRTGEQAEHHPERQGAPAELRTRHGARVWLAGGARERDRKSTRLNSSHVAISYAVFCLKKKKKKKTK